MRKLKIVRNMLFAPAYRIVRYSLVVLALSLLAYAASCAQKQAKPGDQAAHSQPRTDLSKEARVSTYHGIGIVKRINPAFPSVEIDHEEIKGHMPAMIMEWYVKDVSLLKSIKPGDQVEFTLEVPKGGTEVISEIKKR